jgi:hypothetical protein
MLVHFREKISLSLVNKVNQQIVSLAQPHLRPIIRGKAGKNVEFGAKLSASCFDGYVFLDHISYDTGLTQNVANVGANGIGFANLRYALTIPSRL